MNCQHGLEICLECQQTPRERAAKAQETREPWETNADVAKRAGVGHATIERLLQSPSHEGVCNKPTEAIPNWPDFADAEPDVLAWFATFSAWPMPKRKLAYAMFLKQTGVYGL